MQNLAASVWAQRELVVRVMGAGMAEIQDLAPEALADLYLECRRSHPEVWAEVLDLTPQACPQCGGEAAYLGRLGDLDHYRCTRCGWTFPCEW